MPSTERNKAEIIAGVLSIVPGDMVFFYVKNRGIYGVWKVVGFPFFDETRLWAAEKQLYPYRFCFEPALGSFSIPVSLTDVLDLRDKGRIWTFDLNPVQQKNQYKITTAEAREILRLLLRNNTLQNAPPRITCPYDPGPRSVVDVDISACTDPGGFRYEGWLNAWLMRSFARGELKDLFGDYSEFLNLVPTTFNKVMDVFLTHVATMDGIEVPTKYTCIELKARKATHKDLSQTLRYEDWLARRLAGGDKQMIQSTIIAGSFSDEVREYVSERERIEEKTVRLISYRVSDDKRGITLRSHYA